MDESASRAVVYPAPEGAALSEQYAVKVDGKSVDVHIAPVWEPDYGKPFGGPYSFAYFDFAGRVDVEVRSEKPLGRVRVLPASSGIEHGVENGALRFSLDTPCQLAIEPDGKNGPLLLFANPIEANAPEPDAPGVVYFGPGIHRPEEIKLGDNELLYVAGGAIIKGGVTIRGKNVAVAGRGIIEGTDWQRHKGPAPNLVSVTNSENVRISGVILKDAWGWACVLNGSRNIHIDNIKICSARCENNDGIGVVNSQQVKIENCFVRSDDDCITMKGMGWPHRDRERDGMAVDGVSASGCVLWTDRAHIWRLGCESWAEAMRNIEFRDIDVLHWDGPWLATVQPAEDMLMENVLFEDIRVLGDGQRRFIEVYPAPTKWTQRRHTPGSIRNLKFKDIVLTGGMGDEPALIKVSGCSPAHTVENVEFDNVFRYGERVTRDSAGVQVLDHTKNIEF